jgi:hypothetical protein
VGHDDEAVRLVERKREMLLVLADQRGDRGGAETQKDADALDG